MFRQHAPVSTLWHPYGVTAAYSSRMGSVLIACWGAMSIHVFDQDWVLETPGMGYALGINQEGRLAHSYWGSRLPYPLDYPEPPSPPGWASFTNPAHLTPEEYPGAGDMSFVEPCLKVTFADGVRSLVLQFTAAQLLEGDA